MTALTGMPCSWPRRPGPATSGVLFWLLNTYTLIALVAICVVDRRLVRRRRVGALADRLQEARRRDQVQPQRDPRLYRGVQAWRVASKRYFPRLALKLRGKLGYR